MVAPYAIYKPAISRRPTKLTKKEHYKTMNKKGLKEFQLPYDNMGVGHTLENGLRACVDWIQVTFTTITIEQLIQDILQLDLTTFFSGKGDNGYRQSLRKGSIAIFFDGREDMGIHLKMKGIGCREYETYSKRSWQELFKVMFDYQGSFTRLDIAVDDFKGFFTIKGMVKKVKNRELISKFKEATNIEKISTSTGKVGGITLKYGSNTSDVQIRMYNKLIEQLEKGYIVPVEITFWNRTEIQLRNKRAQAVAEILATAEAGEIAIGKTVCGILKHYLRFTVKGKDSNRRRWKIAPFWEKFLAGVNELPLTTIMEEQTIEDKEEWLRRQAAPSLALIYQAYGNDYEQIEKLIKEGSKRLKPNDYDMIKRFKAQKKTSNVAKTKEAS